MTHFLQIITIDGASGTGKGVVGHEVAKRLGWHFLDSGALYRLLGLAAEKQSISLEDEAALVALARALTIQFISNKIFLNQEDVTDSIRRETIGNAASKVGALARVRLALIERQRAFLKPPGLVADGRDMGTVIFPEAPVKIFLEASPKVRAERRYKQLKEMGLDANLGDLIESLRERDKRDRERVVAPLRPAADAILIDTDSLTIDQVVEQVMEQVKIKFPR